MITRGQMAFETNQRGYDVVSSSNERISVKTVTTSSHVSFNASAFEFVDRVMVFRVNVNDELGISVEERRKSLLGISLWCLRRVRLGEASRPWDDVNFETTVFMVRFGSTSDVERTHLNVRSGLPSRRTNRYFEG